VHSVASGAWNVEALFFMLVWHEYRLNKKRTRTHYAKVVLCIW
jgi:hypothetical protein